MSMNEDVRMKSTPAVHTVTQVSTLNALLAGRFDGLMPCRELVEHGDMGIGPFDRMDGELIMVDGVVYQGMPGGHAHAADPETRVPFSTVCRFEADMTWTLDGPIDYEALDKSIDGRATNPNVFIAIRVDGKFSHMKIHALQKQSRPYPPTAEVVKGCVQAEARAVTGTIVGFRGVPWVRGINDEGYHLHFLTTDRSWGGHVLEFTMEQGTCAVSTCCNHVILLPDNGAVLEGIDMTHDLVSEFHEALSR
jgi:acetolactate decarboxylase